MSEASRSVIDGMMRYLGETAARLAGGQTRATVIQSGLEGVNSRSPRVVAVPSPAADRGADSEFRPPTLICVLD